jgi:hypothetical protein
VPVNRSGSGIKMPSKGPTESPSAETESFAKCIIILAVRLILLRYDVQWADRPILLYTHFAF